MSNRLLKGRPGKLLKPRTDIVNSNERTYEHPHRFVTPFDLWTRFNELKAKYKPKDKMREKIIEAYERAPYNCGRDPNWGQFRGMIGKAIKKMVGTLLDRKVWARIETHEGEDNQRSWSDAITDAFHKHCIKPWHKKDMLTIAIAKDAVLWNKSFLHWCTPFGPYPESLDIDNVYFDMNTKLDLDTCEMFFIRKRKSLIEMYNLISDSEYSYEDDGWNKEAVIECITDFADTLKAGADEDSVTEQFKRGGMTQAERDKRISLIYCYVKEYKPAPEGHEREGYCYSLYVIPEDPQGFGMKNSTDRLNENVARKKDYLLFNDYHCCSPKNIVGVQSMHFMDSIHSDDSFARQIYLTCKFYDNSMNRMIRAALRALKLYITTDSQKTKEQFKLSNNAEVEFLSGDAKIEQVQIRQNIGDVAQIARRAVIDMNEQFGMEFRGSANSAKDYPITKAEVEVQEGQLNDTRSADVKIMVSQNRDSVEEIYARFVSLEGHDECKEYDHYRRFVKEMEKKKIPKSAWKKENVEVYSRYNQFAGSASASYTAAKALLDATQIVVSSPAEMNAKREVITSITGEGNVSDFETEPMQFDDELFIIGQENADLDDPHVLPDNVPVLPSHLHLMHIHGHMIDMQEKLGLANQMLVTYSQTQSYQRLFILFQVEGIVNSQDKKGAHIQAHLQLLSKDETHKDEISELMPVLRQTNQQQDLLANQVRQALEKEATNQQIVSKQDQEFQHQSRMNDLQVQAFEAQQNYSLGKVASQVQARQETTEQNQQQKVAHKRQDQQLKTQDKAIDIAAKTESANIDLQTKAAKNALELRNDARKSNESSAKK